MKNNYRILENGTVEIEFNCKGRTLTTVIDAQDFEKVSKYPRKWFGNVDNKSGKIYVYTEIPDKRKKSKQRKVSLHRVIIGLEKDKTLVVDHLNHNTLDNRRSNLRATSFKRNAQRKLERTAHIKRNNKRWGVFLEGELVEEYDTRNDALLMCIVRNLEYFPELEVYHDYDTVLTQAGFDYASMPIQYKENGERDFSRVTPQTVRKWNKGRSLT